MTKLDDFTQAYIEAILFTECHCDNPELEGKDQDDFSQELLDTIIKDCAKFQTENENLIRRAFFKSQTKQDVTQCGHDFWLTRNGHGAGFWDRGLGDIGEALTIASKAFKEINIYLGDDGLVYTN